MKRPIGVFDSGLGGLTVVRQLRRLLPGEDIVYFGDTARVPYGNKSPEAIIRFSRENCRFLTSQNVKMIIVACNTASSLSLEFLKRCFRVPIIGVIEPGAKMAVSSTRNNRVGVIGTNATVSSGAYGKALKKINPRIRMFATACPLFVPLVEEGWGGKKVTHVIASTYLNPLKKSGVDTLVLGCTHYPLLRSEIAAIMGKKVQLVDSAKEVAKEAHLILDANGLLNNGERPARSEFFVSDEPHRFAKLGEKFLRRRLGRVRKI